MGGGNPPIQAGRKGSCASQPQLNSGRWQFVVELCFLWCILPRHVRAESLFANWVVRIKTTKGYSLLAGERHGHMHPCVQIRLISRRRQV